MMVRDRAARVAVAIMELIVVAPGDVLRQRIEDLLREEFSDERRQGVVDRGRDEQCCVCGRALRDHVNTLLGIGPDCAQHMRLPHGLAAADPIVQRRKELLGSDAGMAIAADRSGSDA